MLQYLCDINSNDMKKIIILAFLGIAIASCGQSEETANTENKTTTKSDTQKRVERVDEVTFLAFIQENEDVQIVDVRTPGEFSDGFIPNAVNIDFNGSNFELK